MIDWLMATSIGCSVLGLLFMLAGVASARRRRFVRLSLHITLALACLASGAVFLTLHFSLQSYRALTREDLAATIYAEPVGPSQFRVTIHLANGETASYWLAGDEIYVDARILKWKPWANLFGLHTAYELDRIAGRYHLIEDERVRPRTVYQLNTDRMVDVFALRRRYGWLESAVNAEYGSAAFFPARDRIAIELRVSTTGLLFRPLTKTF
ncbi:MAG: hypothetical protein ABI980_06390 [Nitrospirota bacterium]